MRSRFHCESGLSDLEQPESHRTPAVGLSWPLSPLGGLAVMGAGLRTVEPSLFQTSDQRWPNRLSDRQQVLTASPFSLFLSVYVLP